MENQHRLIKNYRELTKTEIELMNQVKDMGDELLKLMNQVEAFVIDRHDTEVSTGVYSNYEGDENKEFQNESKRWIDEGKFELQKSVMYAVRSITRPKGI